jgi:hypothetical protein
MRGRIQAVVDSDWDVYYCYGYEKHNSDERSFVNGEALEVPQAKVINLGLDYHIRNLHTPILAPNWVIGVTCWDVTNNKRAGSDDNTIPAAPGGVSDGYGKTYINVGTISKETTFKLKLWANQNELEHPSSIPDSSWR